MSFNIHPGVLAVLTVHIGVGLLVKATILLGLAGLLTFFVRRTSAAARCAIWYAAFGMLLLAPIVSLWLPHLQVQQPERHRPAVIAPALPTDAPAILAEEDGGTYKSVVRTEHAAVNNVDGLVERGTVATVLILVWVGVAVILPLRLLIHVLRVGRIAGRAWESHDTEVLSITESLCAGLGIKRRVRVISSDEVTMPFCWGLFRPTIILPESADEWPVDQKRSVLLHELAHVKRYDYPLHLLIEIVRAIYWLNPVVWYAARRAAMDRERACDDIALCEGTPSDEYAGHLLYIARLQLEGVPMGATSLAGEPGLFERVRSVMNRRLNRTPLGWGGILVTGIIALLVTGPIATAWTTQPWQIRPVKDLIVELRSDRDADTRRRAAWALGEREDHRAVQPLVTALDDQDSDVRLTACWALGEIKDRAATERLTETLESDNDPLVREAAALALGEIGDPSLVPVLTSASDREDRLREAVCWALRELRVDPEEARHKCPICKVDTQTQVWSGELKSSGVFSTDIGAVVMQLHSDDAEMRRLAACNLGLLGMLDMWEYWDQVDVAVDHLLDSLRDPDPGVRAMAVWSLDEINPSRSVRDWRRPFIGCTLNEYRLNLLGYYLLELGLQDDAIELFEANVRLNPWSANVYDSLGEGYMRTGKTELAIVNFERSLEIDPENHHAVRMLNDLRGLPQSTDGKTHESLN